MKKKKTKISCFECAHFFTTWDESFPRGCRAMGFKTKRMPSAVVYESSGMPCQRFTGKKTGTRD